MSAVTSSRGTSALLLRARAFAPPGVAGLRPAAHHLRRQPVDQRRRLGRLGPAGRLRDAGLRAAAVVPPGRSRKAKAALRHKRVDMSFRWSMSWFIFSEVMFFGAFFGALCWARSRAADPRQPRQRPALARLQGRLAERRRRLHRLAGRHHRALPHDGPVADADPQHRDPAQLGRHADDRAPRAASPTIAARADRVHVAHGAARHRPSSASRPTNTTMPTPS